MVYIFLWIVIYCLCFLILRLRSKFEKLDFWRILLIFICVDLLVLILGVMIWIFDGIMFVIVIIDLNLVGLDFDNGLDFFLFVILWLLNVVKLFLIDCNLFFIDVVRVCCVFFILLNCFWRLVFFGKIFLFFWMFELLLIKFLFCELFFFFEKLIRFCLFFGFKINCLIRKFGL